MAETLLFINGELSESPLDSYAKLCVGSIHSKASIVK